MRYEDASGAFQASGPVANDDADTLAAGSRGPATGNLITGEGTQYGAAGADSAAGAHVAAIAGQGGEDSSFAGGKLSVSGQYGSLSVDAEGNYSYMANKGAPENVRDRFTYTLADNQGNTDTAALIVELGKTPAVIKADAQQIVPGPDGVVTLPPGVELSDIMVVGRNLVVNMPDGTQLIIVDGAVFVPQLSLGGVEVPATNVAALLVGQEVQPAAGETPPSSGGNFALPPPPLDPGVPLGDLLPPTEYDYIPPDPQEVFDILDEEPEIFVQPDGQPASIAAVDQVEEAGLPTRNGNLPNEPAGSGESADGNGADNDVTSEATTGTIIINSPDGIDSVTITGADGIPREIVVGLVVQGQFGALTITGIVGDDYTYSYVLRDNTSGNDTHDDFSVVLTDDDGDQAAATLRIDIIDDVPTARNDTDASVNGVATGNVMTDAAAGDLGDTDTNAADTVGADNATLTAVSGTGGSDSTFSGGLLNVNGTFGSLAIDAQGNYTYTVNPNAGGGGVDVFTYTLTDGDGDTTTATLTITNPDLAPNLPDPALIRLDDDVIPGAGGNPDGPNDDDPDVVGQNSVNGQLAGTGGDGDLDYAFTGSNTLPAGFTVNVVNAGQVQILQGGTVVMTITLNNETGAFTVVQNAPIDHPSLDGLAGDNTENNLDFSIGVQVVDVDGDVEPGAITINVDDDTPVVNTQVQLGGTVDEDGVLEGADDNGDGDGNPGGVNDVPGESTVVQGNVSALFSPGADQPLTFSLLTDTSGLPQGLTSNGAPVTYSVVGNTLTASANGQPVFTLTVNGTTGEYTFTLLDQLDHPSQDGIEGDDDTENLVDLTLALGSIIQATDADGDSVVAPANGLVITVDDDSPLPFEDCPDDVITVNEVGSTFTGNLNLPPVGADQPGVVSFVVEDGDPVLDNEGNPVTSEGSELFYFVNDAGVLEARAGGETGDVIFTITLNGDGTFTYEQVGVFGEGSEFTFDDLTSSAAGNVEFRGVGADDPATTVDLLLSAGPGDGVTVNTDSDSIGSANQSMDNGEVVRIDLVSDLTTGAGTPSGFGYGAHVSSSSFIGLIPQVQGSQDQTVAFTVWAVNSSNTQAAEPDRDPTGGFSDGSITAVTSVTVKDYLTGESTTADVTGFTVGVFTPVAYGISARVNADGSVTFSGIQQGDSYGFTTGGGEFNAIVVRSEPAGTGGSTQDSYDLGIFSIGVANEFDPFGLSIPIALTDSDGDAVVCDIDVNVGVPLDAPEIVATVNEAGLPVIGSDAASNSEIASGDLQSQVTGGTGPYTFTLVSNGNGAFGTLVLNADGTFTYTLDTPFDSQPDADDGTNPELGAETFTFEATDSLGAKQTGTITINIIDDVPTAVADTDSLPNGSMVATGNVITDASPGDAGDGDNGADTRGADGATVSAVASNNVPANSDNDPAGGFVVVGQYGTLTMQADGSYSYTRADGTPGTFEEVFTYTLTDGDGDSDTATLTISITDAPTTIDVPTQGEAGTLVSEVGLPTRNGGEPAGTGEAADGNSSDNDDTSETTAGTISYTTPDGFGSITIDGVAVTSVGQTFNGAHGVLTITGIAAGSISYSYTLTDNTSGDATLDDFAVVVTDADGDSSSSTLVINIVDDAPLASPDTDVVPAGTYGPATGNVITDAEVDPDSGKDNVGADNAVVAGVAAGNTGVNLDSPATVGAVIQGAYGKLTLNSDGSYSYVRDPGTDGGVSDVFTYTLKDGDGDLVSTTLTIAIEDSPTSIDAPDQGEAGTIVDEQGLPTRNGGEPAGTGEAADGNSSDNDDTSETTGATITYTAPDGPATVTIDGVAVTMVGQTFVGSFGTLTITSIANGSIGYSYTLNDNTSGDATFDDFALQVIDQDGDVANDTLRIDIVDDTPLATNDVDVIVGGNGPATGNVITGVDSGGGDANSSDGNPDNVGADNALVSMIQSNNVPANSDNTPSGGNFVVNGQYGVLTINQDGTYSYLRNDGTPGGVQDVFTYTLTDGDGDTITATLTISIDDNFPNPPANEVVLLDDDTEAGGNAGGPGDRSPDTDNTSGTLEALGGDGDLDYFFSVTQNLPTGFTSNVVTVAGVSTMTISQGGTPVIEITLNNESGAFNVTQLAAIDHAADGNTEGEVPLSNVLSAINVSVYAQDADGDQSPPGTISISVDDDTPTINVSQTNEAGVVLTTQDAETDGNPTAQDTAVSAINFGNVFALASSGGADGGTASPLSFDLNVTTQNSGLTSQGQVINLFEVGGVIYGTTAGVAPVDAATPGVVFSLAVSGTGVVTLTQYQQVDHAVEASPVPGTGAPFDDQFATLVNGKITLTASSSITDGDGDTFTDQEVVDLGGNIRFADDGPDAVNDSANQATENQPVTTGNVLTNDAPGADGVNPATGVTIVGGSLTGAGNLVYNGDGTFTYTPAAGEQGSIQFQYRITDFDGDTDTATVTINLQPDSTPNAVDNVASVDDDGLTNGLPASGSGDLDANAGEAPAINPSEAVWHGQLSATAGNDTIASFTFASMHGTNGSVGTETVAYSWNAGSSTLTATTVGGTRPGTVLFDVVINQGTGEYTLTLRDNVLHADEVANQENDATTNLTFTVTDNDGDSDNGTIVVTFDDDMPQAIQPDAASLENEAGATVTEDLDDDSEVITDFGADGPGLVQFANITPDGHDSGLTSSDDPIEYWLSNNGQTLQARTNSTNGTDGELIFTVQINQATGDYTVTMTGTIDNGAGVTFDNLTSTKAGNVDVRGVGADDPATTVDLLLTASANGANSTINTDSDSIGSANQSMDQGETVRIDFVTNLEINAGLPSGFDYDGHVGTKSLLQDIPQVQGSQNETVAFRVYALNTTVTSAGSPDDTPVAGDPAFSDSSTVDITHVTVDGFDVGEIPVTVALLPAGTWTTVAYGVFARLESDGSVTFTGIQQGDKYGIETATDFNAFAVTSLPAGVGPNAANDSTTNSFDLGIFSIGRVDTGDPIDISLDLSITDADGDTVTMPGAIDITFQPAADSLAVTSFSSQQEQVQKTAANSNTLTMAAAVAASGMADSAAAEPTYDPAVSRTADVTEVSYSNESVEKLAADDDNGVSSLAAQPEASEATVANSSSGNGRGNANGHDNQLDAGSNHSSSDEGASHQAANDQGPAVAEPQVAIAPTVMMASAEQLQAAGLDGEAKQGGSVEKIVAEALGGGDTPTVDGLLAHLAEGLGEVPGLAHVASQDAGSVPGWDMANAAPTGAGFDMLFKVDVATHHQDALQPAVNG